MIVYYITQLISMRMYFCMLDGGNKNKALPKCAEIIHVKLVCDCMLYWFQINNQYSLLAHAYTCISWIGLGWHE